MAPRRYCAWAIWALGAARSSGGADVMPYRDVQPQRESAESLWLGGLPPLERANENLQWCEHYADAVPPIWDTGHAGVELARLVKSGDYDALGGQRARALVLACGTGSDAMFLLERGFGRVACVDVCAAALLQGVAKLWRRLQETRRNAHILFVRGDGVVDRFAAPGLPAPGRSDPTIEFHENDNLALRRQLSPAADFVYDNSAYNNLRNPTAFPGKLQVYFEAVEALLEPGQGLLQIVSGSADSMAKIPFFPEHTEAELRADLATHAPRLVALPGYPRKGVYDFRTDRAVLAHAQLSSAAVEQVERDGGTEGWVTLCRLGPPPADTEEL